MISELESQLIMLKVKVVETTQKLHYNIAVSKKKHQAAVERAEFFAGDFMAYLNEPAVWAKLNLDSFQNGALNTLIEAAKTGNLYNNGSRGFYDGFPFLSYGFADYDDFSKILVGNRLRFGNYNNIFFSYNVKKDLPVSAWFGGLSCDESGPAKTGDISFLFSPDPITADNIAEIEQKSMLKNTTVTTTQNRILLEYSYLGCTSHSQYHLLGEMEWSLAPTLLVYVHNDSTTRFTRTEEATEKELSFALK